MSEHYQYLFYALFAAYAALLVTAAILDSSKFIIPNSVTVCLVLLFIVAAAILPFDTAWLSHLGAAATVFVVGLVAYKFNALGAGDIKLITAISLWASFEFLPEFLLATAIAGGVVALTLMLLRTLIVMLAIESSTLRNWFSWPRLLCRGEPVPYGVAIAAGAMFLGTKSQYLLGYV